MDTIEIVVAASAALVGLAFGFWRIRRSGSATPAETAPLASTNQPATEAETGRNDLKTDDPAATPQAGTSLETRLAANRGWVSRLRQLFAEGEVTQPDWEDTLEEICLGADLGIATTERLIDRVRQVPGDASAGARLDALREEMHAILTQAEAAAIPFSLKDQAQTLLIVGVNGAGKTTSIGKLAAQLKDAGQSVMLAAGDTFRAAAVEQLAGWARRVNVPIHQGPEGADPASVLYEAAKAAEREPGTWLLADTAGRLHTKHALMDELARVRKSVTKARDGKAPEHTWLVIDATTGQNGLTQAKEFHHATPLTGVILTKLDGTAKGGIALSICQSLGVPVRFVGVGEKVGDLQAFDPQSYLDALLAEDTAEDTATAAPSS